MSGSKMSIIKRSEADLKVVQTGATSKKLYDEFIELCLTCKSSIFRTIICQL